LRMPMASLLAAWSALSLVVAPLAGPLGRD
jgi:hypothetical protein